MDTTKIIVAGCGPTGAMVSSLLSQYSIPHVVLERDEVVNSDPRGIALDEDGIRCLQACGIYDKIFTEIGQCWSLSLLPLHDQQLIKTSSLGMGHFDFIGGTQRDLSRKPFMTMNYSTVRPETNPPFHP